MAHGWGPVWVGTWLPTMICMFALRSTRGSTAAGSRLRSLPTAPLALSRSMISIFDLMTLLDVIDKRLGTDKGSTARKAGMGMRIKHRWPPI